MKRLFTIILAVLTLTSCTQNGVDELVTNRTNLPDTLTVGFEGGDDDTRIQLNGAQKTVWNKGDEVSVFYQSYTNMKWLFQGENGDRTGKLKAENSNFGDQTMDEVFIIYPYNPDYRINAEQKAVIASLPATQSYVKGSYGREANIMVATSEFSTFTLKSVCGWLKVQLTGYGEKVQSIKLRGNNGEQVAGLVYIDIESAGVTFPGEVGDYDDVENSVGGGLDFEDAISNEAKLDCGDGVELGAEVSSFYIALLPQTFENGLSIDVKCEDHKPITISTDKSLTIERNHIKPMEVIELEAKNRIFEITEIGTDYFVFNVNLDGDYRFFAFEKAYLTIFGSAENYLAQKGILENSPKSFRWENGGSYGNESISVNPNTTYVIAAVNCDANGNFYDSEGNLLYEIYTCEVTTKALNESQADVDITLSNITSTSVDIKAVPNELVSTYYLFIQESATFNESMEKFGQEAYMAAMKGKYAWSAMASLERTWEGLTPSTDYTLMKLIVDRSGAEFFTWQEFTTLAPSGAPAEVNAELVVASTDPHKTLELIIQTNGASGKYAFNTTVDVNIERAKGMTDADIAAYRGVDLTGEQMTEATLTGTRIKLENLWPETEYTAIVNVLNEEKTVTTKTLTFKTPAKALPARVESELFTSLIGEWKVTYNYMDYYYENKHIDGAVVKIAAGVDDYTSELYRSHNRLVILDWPYQDNWQNENYTTFLPEYLMTVDSYWAENPSLAYRDYGPKIFLEIAANDVVTVPTEKNTYFFNPQVLDNFSLSFYGTDYHLKQNAPCAFPVSISADGNTITIGQCISGAEFDYGVYRPAIWNNNIELCNLATSDIVLQRVK